MTASSASPPPPADPDPLLRAVVLDRVTTIPVLGVPTTFRTNSDMVLEAVEASFGAWRTLAESAVPSIATGLGTATGPAIATGAATATGPGVDVRVVVHDGGAPDTDAATVTYRMPDPDRVLFHTRGSFGVADTSRGDAVVYVSPQLVADAAHFAYGLLKGLTLVLVTCRDRSPVHATMLERSGTAVVLAAPSGVGKSTLAYQASRCGWRVLTDDAVYVQAEPAYQVWGAPGPVYLPGDTAAWFSELEGRTPVRQANGKVKLEVDVPLPDTLAPRSGRSVALCLLARGSGPSLERVEADEGVALLAGDLAMVRDMYGPALDRALGLLTEGGAWRLTLSGQDPSEGPALLDALVDRVERT